MRDRLPFGSTRSNLSPFPLAAGIPVSHGCVRLGIGPAELIWNWADTGTPVVVH